MTVRSVTVRVGIMRSASFQSISFEIAEQMGLAEGENWDEVVNNAESLRHVHQDVLVLLAEVERLRGGE